MDVPDERAAELIAGAVAGDLTADEVAELDRLRAADPTIDHEIASLRAVADRISAHDLDWVEVSADDALRDRITAATSGAAAAAAAAAAEEPTSLPSPVPIPAGATTGRARRRGFAPLLAAACLALGLMLGLGAGLAAPVVFDATPQGPPGTLGAVEPIEVQGEPAGVEVDADIVAHTWGTEAVLRATGLSVGETYSVVLIGNDGQEFSAGEMIGSTVPILCHLNAAVLREDVASMVIRAADGQTVATAELPAVNL